MFLMLITGPHAGSIPICSQSEWRCRRVARIGRKSARLASRPARLPRLCRFQTNLQRSDWAGWTPTSSRFFFLRTVLNLARWLRLVWGGPSLIQELCKNKTRILAETLRRTKLRGGLRSLELRADGSGGWLATDLRGRL